MRSVDELVRLTALPVKGAVEAALVASTSMVVFGADWIDDKPRVREILAGAKWPVISGRLADDITRLYLSIAIRRRFRAG